MKLPTVSRPLLLSGLALVSIGIAWQVVKTGMAEVALQRGQPDLALAFWPNYASAASQRAENFLGPGQPRRAQAFAILALRNSLQDSQALRTIASAAGAMDDQPVADQAMVLAARLGWRDGFAQQWLFRRALNDDPVTAAQAGDALLRMGLQRDVVVAGMRRLLASDAGRAAVAERMSERPPWAAAFLSELRPRTSEETAAYGQFIVDLHVRGVRPSNEEVSPFFVSAIGRGDLQNVLTIWKAMNEQVSGDPSRGVIDGNFAQLENETTPWGPFGWRTRDRTGIMLAVRPRTEFSVDRALDVSLEGKRTERPLAQVLALRPGAYNLAYQALLESGSRGAFRWELACVESRETLLRHVPVKGRPEEWADQSAGFRVPPSGCQVQSLTLVVTSTQRQPASARFAKLEMAPAR